MSIRDNSVMKFKPLKYHTFSVNKFVQQCEFCKQINCTCTYKRRKVMSKGTQDDCTLSILVISCAL